MDNGDPDTLNEPTEACEARRNGIRCERWIGHRGAHRAAVSLSTDRLPGAREVQTWPNEEDPHG